MRRAGEVAQRVALGALIVVASPLILLFAIFYFLILALGVGIWRLQGQP